MSTSDHSSPPSGGSLPAARLAAGDHPFSPLPSPSRAGTHAPKAAPTVPPQPVAGGANVTLTIDGDAVTVAAGTNVLEACKLRGLDISHFCYHPGLKIAASCRQCLVEIEKMPKLMPSCQATVNDGMVVHTNSPRVLEARRQMLEFTLKNHPIDCPICDKAGECILQRHYMDHDHTLTRVDVSKVRKAKAKDIGREIILDQERCILCGRCVRFCQEVSGTSELGFMWRGDHQTLDISEGRRLDNAYSMNVVDLCPVGALTAKDFRFQVRAWELKATATTCGGCATGCAAELHSRNEDAHRVVPRHDPDVNGFWMCDEGRHIYKELASDRRVRQATVDGDATGLADAVATAVKRLQSTRIAVVFSATATNEANAALADLAQQLDATRFVLGRPDGEGDDILRDPDKNPNTAGAKRAAGSVTTHLDQFALELAGRAYETVVFLDGTGELSEVVRTQLGSVTSICLADRRSPLADACSIVLPAAGWGEVLGTYTNRQGRLRVLQPAWRAEGERKHRADILADILAALGREGVLSAMDRSAKLAAEYDHAELRDLTQTPKPHRPTLLRWAHTRG